MPPSSNAAYDMVTIYSPEGNPVTVSRLNAIDLIRTAGHGWRRAKDSEDAAPADAPVPSEPQEPVDVPEPTKNDMRIETQRAVPQFAAPASLEAEAKAVADFDSLEDYLNTFDQAALRVMLEEKFGEKVHGRTSKEKVISKIIAANDEQGGTAF